MGLDASSRFDLFRAFHVTAAKHGDGVLVRVD